MGLVAGLGPKKPTRRVVMLIKTRLPSFHSVEAHACVDFEGFE
jgi:hypothetical protein